MPLRQIPRSRKQRTNPLRQRSVGNLNDVGSVIVGDADGRYFERAATRNYIVGVSVNVSL